MTSSKNKKVKTISPVFDLVHGLAALGVVALGVVGHRARQAESEEGLIFLCDQQSNWMTCYLFMVRADKSGHEGAFCTFQARNLAL